MRSIGPGGARLRDEPSNHESSRTRKASSNNLKFRAAAIFVAGSRECREGGGGPLCTFTAENPTEKQSAASERNYSTILYRMGFYICIP